MLMAASAVIDSWGVAECQLKSDQEPALVGWKSALARKLGTGYQVVPELSPVGESESNGAIEVGVGQISGDSREPPCCDR